MTPPPWPVVADMVGHLAWPGFFLLLVLIARREIGRLFGAFADRVADPDQRVAAGPAGVTLERVNVAEQTASRLTVKDAGSEPETPTERIRRAYVEDPAFRDRLEAWMRENTNVTSVTIFLYGSPYESAHAIAAEDLFD